MSHIGKTWKHMHCTSYRYNVQISGGGGDDTRKAAGQFRTPELVDIATVAMLLGVGESNVRRLVAKRQIEIGRWVITSGLISRSS